jgi:uncharacterized protein
VASHKAVVEAYVDGFCRGDHAQILACLTDGVVWVLHGAKTLTGKDAFAAEIANETAIGNPALVLDQIVEEGDVVAVVGHGEVALREVGPLTFVFSEVFTFTGDRVSRLETFHINLAGPADHARSAPAAP